MSNDVRFDSIGSINRMIVFCFRFRCLGLLRKLIALVFHIELPLLKHGLRLPHPYGIVVNPSVAIGENVTIYQGVTIGSKRFGPRQGVPVIGDHVVIYPNAVIVGKLIVGGGATIAPGSVVVSDIAAGDMVAGNPARSIRKADSSLCP